jgi:hypothetical protein
VRQRGRAGKEEETQAANRGRLKHEDLRQRGRAGKEEETQAANRGIPKHEDLRQRGRAGKEKETQAANRGKLYTKKSDRGVIEPQSLPTNNLKTLSTKS